MIFLDNASTTKVDNDILENFTNYQNKFYFNPGAVYKVSTDIARKIDETREKIVNLLGGDPKGTFIFTGSSTEANNIILNSLVTNNKNEEYVFSKSEHPSVRNFASKILQEGKKVVLVEENRDGTINEEDLYSKINKNTKLVSIINVSNETGVVNNVSKIAGKIKEINPKTFVHSDGVQALGKIEVCLDNIDFFTISSHKIYGLKGIAGFYARNIKLLKPFIIGGGQEFNIRSGTANAPMIFSLLDTIKKAVKEQHSNYEKVKEINSYLRKRLTKIDNISFNSPQNSSPYILSFSVIGLNAETILNALSEKEIYVGLGSACSSKKSGNYMLEAMNKTKEEILGNLRISFSKNTTKQEVEIFFDEFEKEIIDKREKLK